MSERSRKTLNMIMALIVSLGAWMFVVYTYYPMTDVAYTDVPLSFAGERTLAERGLAVSDASLNGIEVTLRQKRTDVNKISSADIEANIDVSSCVAGDNSVSVSVSGPKDTNVRSIDTDSVNVTVERTADDYMDIDVIYADLAPEGEKPYVTYIGRYQARVVCAASKIENVKSIAAVIDYDEVSEKTKSFTAELVAIDANGEVVPHAMIYPEEISLDASYGMSKEVAVELAVSNDDDDRYERTYTAPETVTITGPKEAVSAIESIKSLEIDLSRYYEDSEIEIEFDIPEEISIEEEPVLKLKVSAKPEQSEDEKSGENEGG